MPELVDNYGRAFAISRDGRYISVAGAFYGNGDLSVISRNGVGVRLTTASGANVNVAPAWSPAAFIDAKGRHVVIVYPSGRRRWILGGSWVSAVAWSPTGKRIAYAVSGHRPGLWIATLASRRTRRVVDLPLAADSISWSPHGDWLLVGGRELDVLVRPNGRDLHTEGDTTSPQWSPDGRRLAYFTASTPTWLRVVRPASNAAQEPVQWLASADRLCRSYPPRPALVLRPRLDAGRTSRPCRIPQLIAAC